MRLEDLEKQTKKQTVKDAHATIILAEKMGINADSLREMLLEANNWDRIQTVTRELKAKVETEARKTQVTADMKPDTSQGLSQTANQTVETANMLSKDTSSQTVTGTTSLTQPFVKTVVATVGATSV